MASITYSVTLHHLASGATKAGLAYADEQLSGVNADQLRTLLDALQGVASRLTIYEPSSPEIRIKTDREVFVVAAGSPREADLRARGAVVIPVAPAP